MLSAVLAVVGGTGHVYVAVFNGDCEIGVNGLLEFAFGAFDCYVVSADCNCTSKGVMTNKQALTEKVGGEVLCYIY